MSEAPIPNIEEPKPKAPRWWGAGAGDACGAGHTASEPKVVRELLEVGWDIEQVPEPQWKPENRNHI